MSRLEALKSGKLLGAKALTLAEGLDEFPEEIYTLADTLEVLDMTNNNLSALPSDFGKLKKLKILFLSNNKFTKLPTCLADCPQLSMVGFRNNQIETVAEDSLPLSIRWLILTDNNISKLPDSLGKLTLLQKFMLSGNQLTTLPQSLANCHNLELLRIAVNNLKGFPEFLLELPKLSWLAYGGNPFCEKHPDVKNSLEKIDWDRLQVKELLGQGASGEIYKAVYAEKEVAIKVFKGEITSDGLPKEEMDINISLGKHPHLIEVLALVTGHPKKRDVLMMELIPKNYFNLGLPPTLKSCSRDVYEDGFSLTFLEARKILKSMAEVGSYIHARGIIHGDFYAHNIMINKEANTILGDFGGASYVNPKEQKIHKGLERLEVRAFGCLLEEMLRLCHKDNSNLFEKEKLQHLQARCMLSETKQRPLFKEIIRSLM